MCRMHHTCSSAVCPPHAVPLTSQAEGLLLGLAVPVLEQMLVVQLTDLTVDVCVLECGVRQLDHQQQEPEGQSGRRRTFADKK
jgi:hypothetical protein